MPCPVPRQPWHVICHHAAGPKRSPSWCAAALLTRFDFNVARVVHSSGRVHSGRRHGLRILHSARAEGLLSTPERGRVGYHLLLRVPLSRSGGRRRVEPRSSEGRQQGTAGRVAYVRPVAGVSPAPLAVPSASRFTASAAGFLNLAAGDVGRNANAIFSSLDVRRLVVLLTRRAPLPLSSTPTAIVTPWTASRPSSTPRSLA